MIPVVLVHGGGFDSRCWDLVLPHLPEPALAVDLPGRGRHPAPLEDVDAASCAASIRADIDAAGFDEVVLVGHSLAGCTLPATMGLLGARVKHAIFVACTVPEQGRSAFDTLDDEIKAAIVESGRPLRPQAMDPEMAKAVFGNDLDEAQQAWCAERLVAEAPKLTTDPVDLSPLQAPVPRTWICTLRDLIVAPGKQRRFAANVGDCPVVDFDAGHMCMISQPEFLARTIAGIAG